MVSLQLLLPAIRKFTCWYTPSEVESNTCGDAEYYRDYYSAQIHFDISTIGGIELAGRNTCTIVQRQHLQCSSTKFSWQSQNLFQRNDICLVVYVNGLHTSQFPAPFSERLYVNSCFYLKYGYCFGANRKAVTVFEICPPLIYLAISLLYFFLQCL